MAEGAGRREVQSQSRGLGVLRVQVPGRKR